MTIIDDYLDFQEKYSNEYGEFTCVLMQVGHFFESYAVDNEHERSNADNIYRLSDVMNIQLTRKNKSIAKNSRKNPLMIGVNLFSYDKYVQILLNANYTVVVIEQTTPPPEPEREVTNIFSPGINMQHEIKGSTSNCVCLYMETVKDLKKYKDVMYIGISCIDLSTGTSKVFETYSNIQDKTLALDEAFRFIQITDPKEVLIYKKDISLNNSELSGYLDLSSRVTHIKESSDIPNEFLNISYQKTFFEKIYKNTGLLSVIEYLDLETRPFGTISFMCLLDFAYKHNENIINQINKPEIVSDTNNLILTNNTINQLNVVAHTSNNNNMKFNSLYAVINNNNTAIGRRYLRERLLNPITDIDILNKRYDCISEMMTQENTQYLYLYYEDCLKKIIDIERLHRRLGLKMLQPADFGGLDVSYQYIKKMLEKDNKNLNKLKPDSNTIRLFNEFIEQYKTDFNIDEIVKYHLDKITNSFFNKNISSDIDRIQESIDESLDILNKISKKLSFYLEDLQKSSFYNNPMVKVEYNDVRGYHLICTTKRCGVLKTRFKNMNYSLIKVELSNGKTININPKDIVFKPLNSGKTSSSIILDLIEKTSNKLIANRSKIQDLCLKVYLDKCVEYHEKYGEALKQIAKYVGNIDVIKSCTKTALMYGYTRPIIEDNQDTSYIKAEQIRHPIIERIQQDYEYIPNDVNIGLEKNNDSNDSDQNDNDSNNNKSLYGMLLYGTNAAGKSSLMKAMGLNIILAQAGMFVASKSFTYKPYNYLFTRINNNDNIFKGESSFAVEMSELRSILKRSNKNSLILGDELCSGTESISAQSIFASSVVSLVNKKASFIFATHLHELTKMKEITELESVKMFHLKVHYDEKTGKLVYDRILEEGSGQAIYGLEVCKAMDMDNDFLDLAHKIRKRIMNQSDNLVDIHQSTYNTDLFVDKCSVCNEKAEDVHHIKFQCTADINNMIGHIQKDTKSNLVTLCKQCHLEVHNGGLSITGYKQTSNGVELDYTILDKHEVEDKKKSRRKFTDSQIETIKSFINENRNVNRVYACEKLKQQHNIHISKATLGKIVNGKY